MTWPIPAKVKEFYGNPDINNDGFPDSKWEASNLLKIIPPYPMFWSWSGEPVRTIRVHKKCSQSLLKCLSMIGDAFSAVDRHKYQLDQCGGAYTFRLMRGYDTLSMHSYGCAIDLGPKINGLGVPYDPMKNMMPQKAVQIFKSEKWKWGGMWPRPDSMHFEATQ